MIFSNLLKGSIHNPGSKARVRIFIPAIILLSVYIFNLEHIFADVLWHDDGLFYYLATEGRAFQIWRGKIALLTPFRDYFYSNGMLYLGLPVTRSAFVLIMSLCSISLYYIFTNIFGIAAKIAVPAAVLPNILPSLIGIPLSLNASYAMWGLLAMLLSMQLMYFAFTKSDRPPNVYWVLSFLAYAIGLNLAVSTNFLIPSFLLFFGMFFLSSPHKLRAIALVSPFVALGSWQLYRHIIFNPKTPTQIPLDVVFDRSIQFLEMGSFLPFNSPFSVHVTLFFILVGLIGIVASNIGHFVKPPHFNFSEPMYRLMMVSWPFVWIVCNSIAYVAVSPDFRVDDYAYIANFGIVFLQVCGMAYLWYWITRRLGWQKEHTAQSLVLVFVGLVIFTGIQKLGIIQTYLTNNAFVNASPSLRRQLQQLDIPADSQIVIFDAPTSHPGHYGVSSGTARYLLRRKDVRALFGPTKFPNDIFSKSTSFFDRMKNFDPGKPVLIFQNTEDGFTQKKLLLQTKATALEASQRLQWALYDVSQPGEPPIKIASNLDMSSYYDFIENQLPPPFTSSDIAFGPGNNPGTFLSAQQAEEFARNSGLIDSELDFSDVVTLRAVHKTQFDSREALELLIQARDRPGSIKLGYRITAEEPIQLNIWEMAMDGDNILIKMEIPDSHWTKGEVAFQFLDMGVWPYRPLSLSSNSHQSEIILVLE